MSENPLLVIKDLRKQLKTGALSSVNEANARQVVVERLLQALNWDVYNLEEFRAEYAMGGQKVDYALLVSKAPKVFIEVKKPAVTDLARHEKQLLAYAFQTGLPLALLTNCVQWWFYLPQLPETDWSDRRCCVIDLEAGEPVKIRDQFVELLAKEEVLSGRAEEYARHLHQSRKRQEAIEAAMPEAWNKMISERDEALVELLIKRTRSLLGGSRPGKKVTEDFLSRHEGCLRVRVKHPKL